MLFCLSQSYCHKLNNTIEVFELRILKNYLNENITFSFHYQIVVAVSKVFWHSFGIDFQKLNKFSVFSTSAQLIIVFCDILSDM